MSLPLGEWTQEKCDEEEDGEKGEEKEQRITRHSVRCNLDNHVMRQEREEDGKSIKEEDEVEVYCHKVTLSQGHTQWKEEETFLTMSQDTRRRRKMRTNSTSDSSGTTTTVASSCCSICPREVARSDEVTAQGQTVTSNSRSHMSDLDEKKERNRGSQGRGEEEMSGQLRSQLQVNPVAMIGHSLMDQELHHTSNSGFSGICNPHSHRPCQSHPFHPSPAKMTGTRGILKKKSISKPMDEEESKTQGASTTTASLLDAETTAAASAAAAAASTSASSSPGPLLLVERRGGVKGGELEKRRSASESQTTKLHDKGCRAIEEEREKRGQEEHQLHERKNKIPGTECSCRERMKEETTTARKISWGGVVTREVTTYYQELRDTEAKDQREKLSSAGLLSSFTTFVHSFFFPPSPALSSSCFTSQSSSSSSSSVSSSHNNNNNNYNSSSNSNSNYHCINPTNRVAERLVVTLLAVLFTLASFIGFFYRFPSESSGNTSNGSSYCTISST